MVGVRDQYVSLLDLRLDLSAEFADLVRYNSISLQYMDDQISARLADAHHSLREELAAAEAHFERLEELLAAGESKKIASLNRAARRLRSFEGQLRWSSVLVEATQGFSGRAALFTIRGSSLHLEAARNAGGGASIDVPLDSAPAFRSAVDTRDTVIAMRSGGEMSAPIASYLGEAATGRFHLFPIAARERVVAVLYADSEQGGVEADAIELLTTLAGAVLDSRASAPLNGLVKIAESSDYEDAALTASLSLEERDLHLRAQRFARVQAADMRLYKSEDVKNGRAARDLYTSLKEEIDSAREIFRRDFLSGRGMVDYLHLELVHTLANGEVQLLGSDYPGPML